MALSIQRRKKGRSNVATTRYDVEYEDGRKRVKLLTAEDAQEMGEQKGIKSIKRQAAAKSSGRGSTGSED